MRARGRIRSLPAGVGEPLAGCCWPEGIRHYRFPVSTWKHFERLSRLPRGVLPVADAFCRFNPIHGQGMSSAAKQALLLHDVLDRAAADPDPIAAVQAGFMAEAASVLEQRCQRRSRGQGRQGRRGEARGLSGQHASETPASRTNPIPNAANAAPLTPLTLVLAGLCPAGQCLMIEGQADTERVGPRITPGKAFCGPERFFRRFARPTPRHWAG
jgi:hypothetical protein